MVKYLILGIYLWDCWEAVRVACNVIRLFHSLGVDSINDLSRMTNELYRKSNPLIRLLISVCHGLKIPKVNL